MSPLFKVYKKVVQFSFTPTKNILVFSFSILFQFIQRIEHCLLIFVWLVITNINICSQSQPPLHKVAPQEMDVVAEVARQILEEALEEAKTEPEVKTTESENEVTNDVIEQDEQNDSEKTQENTKHDTIEVQADIENVDEQSLERNLSLVNSTQIIDPYLYTSFENFINQT